MTPLRRHIFVAVLLLPFIGLFAQQDEADSLRKVIAGSKDPFAVASAYASLGEVLFPSSPDTLLPLSLKALELLDKIPVPAEKNKKNEYLDLKAYILNNSAYVMGQRGLVEKSLERYLQSLDLYEITGNSEGIGATLNNIAYIYQNQANPEKALEYFHRCIKLFSRIGYKEGIARVLNNIGFLYQQQGNYDSSLSYHNQSLALNLQIGDTAGIASSYANIGQIREVQGELDEALRLYLESYKLNRASGQKQNFIYALDNISQVYIKKENWKQARAYALESMRLSEELPYPENIRNSARLMYSIYRHDGDFRNALTMHELYIRMRDSINNLQTRNSSLKQQFKYEYGKKAAADSVRVAQEKIVTTAQLKQEQTQRYALYGGLSVVLLFAGFMFNRFKASQQQKKIIEEQKHLVEEKQKEILDSIHYARRIQHALLTPEVYISRKLSELKKNK